MSTDPAPPTPDLTTLSVVETRNGSEGPVAAGWRLTALLALALALLLSRASERYTPAFQTFPAVDWWENHVLDETSAIPSAAVLAERSGLPTFGFAPGPAEPYLPQFALPGFVVRTVGGLRDGSTTTSETRTAPAEGTADRASLTLRVLVFHRSLRAAAWADLRGTQLDLARQGTGEARSFRVTGPESADTVRVEDTGGAPRGLATVIGHRGPIAYEVEAAIERSPVTPPEGAPRANLAARAERLARGAAAEWIGWLAAQPYALPDWQPPTGGTSSGP